MNITCFYDQTPFTLSTEEKVAALRKMHAENLHHYDARCPRCGRANAVSRERLEMFTPGWEEAIKAPAASPIVPEKSAMPTPVVPAPSMPQPSAPAASMPAAVTPTVTPKAAPARRRHAPAAKKATRKAKPAPKKAVKKARKAKVTKKKTVTKKVTKKTAKARPKKKR
jgi:hypothetical protein